MNERKTFSVAQLAIRYQVTEVTVRRWIDDGLFPGARKKGPYDNSPYVIPLSAVESFEEAYPDLAPA